MKKMLLHLILVLLFAIPVQSGAGVNLPWSTTYKYPTEWLGGKSTCPAPFLSGGDWGDNIIAAANRSAGGGGMGQRHFLAPGRNVNSGGLGLYFNQPMTEFWTRWYMRFQPGLRFEGSGSMKALYLFDVAHVWGFGYLTVSNNYIDYHVQLGTSQRAFPVGTGLGLDGAWHCIELHIKSETGAGKNDGILEIYFDGQLRRRDNDVDFGLNSLGKTFGLFIIGSNHGVLTNAETQWVDFDDIAVSTSRIGSASPLSPAPFPPQDTVPPAPPQGLKMQ